jgi:hypothetical protein
MNNVVLVLSPNIQLWVGLDELSKVVVWKDPERRDILAGDWILKAISFEVLLKCFCLERITTWKNQWRIYYFLHLFINT